MQSSRTPFAILAFAALIAGSAVAPSTLGAQAAPAAAADSMAFPRQAVKWFQSSQADSLFALAGEQLMSSMKSAAVRVPFARRPRPGSTSEIVFVTMPNAC